MMIFTWLISIVVIILFVKYGVDHDIFRMNKQNNKNRKFKILKKRYANGNIKKDEYESEKKDLDL